MRQSDGKNLENLKGKLCADLLLEIPKPLLKWYDNGRRELPWRSDPTAYKVWVSEIMLQQTRVEAVKPYFERFMTRLPDIASLAGASEEELLKLWEGLGYYNRVRNLKNAAIQIMEQYDGKMPASYEEILTLKGIGSYTAGAIASIAFGLVYPAVDGNVLRVLARVRLDERLISDAKVKKEVEQELQQAMPAERPGDFNQAMMELGAMVCIPNGSPHCEECPLSQLCLAHARRQETAYPRKEKKKERRIEKKTVLLIRDEDKVALVKRKDKGLLAGLYQFPMLEGYCSEQEVKGYVAEQGLKMLRILPLQDAKHIFTHKEWHMKGFLIRVDELERPEEGMIPDEWLFVECGEVKEHYPVPSAFSAYAQHLQIRLGAEKWKEDAAQAAEIEKAE